MSLSIKPGDCYRLDIGSVQHFFFVISAPDTYPSRPVVMVPMTKVSHDKSVDKSCLITPGEHPCCIVPSFAAYGWALVFSPQVLEVAIRVGKAVKRAPADAALLRRLRDGAEVSDDLPDGVRKELWEQGILRPF